MVNTRQSQLILLSLVVLGSLFLTYSGGPARQTPVSRDVSVPEAKALMDAGALVIDVRDRAVSGPSHIPGALLIPIDSLLASIAEVAADKTKPMVIYCNDGNVRGPQATEMLNKSGYAQAVNLKSGIEGWRAAKLPTAGAK